MFEELFARIRICVLIGGDVLLGVNFEFPNPMQSQGSSSTRLPVYHGVVSQTHALLLVHHDVSSQAHAFLHVYHVSSQAHACLHGYHEVSSQAYALLLVHHDVSS